MRAASLPRWSSLLSLCSARAGLRPCAPEQVCKFFLDAVEKSQYGWFWECPNGVSCHYRHALPPGFTLKRDKKKDDGESKISIDEFIETEVRARGGGGGGGG